MARRSGTHSPSAPARCLQGCPPPACTPAGPCSHRAHSCVTRLERSPPGQGGGLHREASLTLQRRGARSVQEGLAEAPGGCPFKATASLQPPQAVYTRAFYNKMPGAGHPPQPRRRHSSRAESAQLPWGGARAGRAHAELGTAPCTRARPGSSRRRAPHTTHPKNADLGDAQPVAPRQASHADGPGPQPPPGKHVAILASPSFQHSQGQQSPRAADTSWPQAGPVPQELRDGRDMGAWAGGKYRAIKQGGRSQEASCPHPGLPKGSISPNQGGGGAAGAAPLLRTAAAWPQRPLSLLTGRGFAQPASEAGSQRCFWMDRRGPGQDSGKGPQLPTTRHDVCLSRPYQE